MNPDDELKRIHDDPAFAGGTTYGRTPGGVVDLRTQQIAKPQVYSDSTQARGQENALKYDIDAQTQRIAAELPAEQEATIRKQGDEQRALLDEERSRLDQQRLAVTNSINAAFTQRESDTKDTQGREMSSTSTALNTTSGGYLGATFSQEGVLKNLERTHQKELSNLSALRAQAIADAQRHFDDRSFELSKEKVNLARQIENDISQRRNEFIQRSIEMNREVRAQAEFEFTIQKYQQEQVREDERFQFEIQKYVADITRENTQEARQKLQDTQKLLSDVLSLIGPAPFESLPPALQQQIIEQAQVAGIPVEAIILGLKHAAETEARNRAVEDQKLALERSREARIASGGGGSGGGLTPYQTMSLRNQIEDNMRINPAIQAFGELENFGVPTVIERFNNGETDSVADTILMRTLAKVTDPTTGVREEEYRTFESAVGAINQVRVLPQKWVGQGRLTADGRAAMIREIQDRYTARLKDYQTQYTYYQNQAANAGLTVPPSYSSSVGREPREELMEDITIASQRNDYGTREELIKNLTAAYGKEFSQKDIAALVYSAIPDKTDLAGHLESLKKMKK